MEFGMVLDTNAMLQSLNCVLRVGKHSHCQYFLQSPRTRTTASSRLLIPCIGLWIWRWGSLAHSWCSAAFSSCTVSTGGSCYLTRRPYISEICSFGLRSGLLVHHGIVSTAFWRNNCWRHLLCGAWSCHPLKLDGLQTHDCQNMEQHLLIRTHVDIVVRLNSLTLWPDQACSHGRRNPTLWRTLHRMEWSHKKNELSRTRDSSVNVVSTIVNELHDGFQSTWDFWWVV